MHARKLRTTGMIAVLAVMQLYVALPAEATHLKTKYSDPTLQGLLTDPFSVGFGFFVVDIINITADVRCCPKPDTDKGCKTSPENHLVDAAQITFDFGAEDCQNAQRCNFQDDIATLRHLADRFQELACPGTQVIRDINGVPEMAFDSLTGRVTGVDCLSDQKCTCSEPAGCPVVQCFLGEFSYPFTLKTLPMSGTFKSVDKSLALGECYNGTWVGSPPSP